MIRLIRLHYLLWRLPLSHLFLMLVAMLAPQIVLLWHLLRRLQTATPVFHQIVVIVQQHICTINHYHFHLLRSSISDTLRHRLQQVVWLRLRPMRTSANGAIHPPLGSTTTIIFVVTTTAIVPQLYRIIVRAVVQIPAQNGGKDPRATKRKFLK